MCDRLSERSHVARITYLVFIFLGVGLSLLGMIANPSRITVVPVLQLFVNGLFAFVLMSGATKDYCTA